MIEVKRSKNGYNYDVFDIVTNEGILEISYENNFDLYWSYKYMNMIDKEGSIKELVINKENYYVYSLFDELYNNIKNHTPWKYYENDDFELEHTKVRDYNCLYHNKMITWYSDDFADINLASSFTIKKYKDKYIVIIKKSGLEPSNGNYFETFVVRIRNSGSRYDPYNIAFMGMYQRLKEYNFDYHQIHIEEYLYSKKRCLLKK